jgi:hypothetical protein|tara:strand:- start:3045 stop:3224 length:180 start_codon:yes stop_codon:yes gene_type:complete
MKKQSLAIVNQVKKIRTKNNTCWMELLKLALEYAPEKSKKVLKEINKNDKQITSLIGKL